MQGIKVMEAFHEPESTLVRKKLISSIGDTMWRSSSPFPLTLTLSPREKEQRR